MTGNNCSICVKNNLRDGIKIRSVKTLRDRYSCFENVFKVLKRDQKDPKNWVVCGDCYLIAEERCQVYRYYLIFLH